MNSLFTRSQRLLSLALCLGIAASSASASIERTYSETLDLEGISTVELVVFGGHVELKGAEGVSSGELKMDRVFKTDSESTADSWESEITRTVERDEDTLSIRFELEGWNMSIGFSGIGRKIDIETELELPSSMNVVLKTGGGHLTVEDIDGDVTLRTAGGHIEAKDLGGNLDSATSGGHIDVDGVKGSVELKTSGGHVEVKDLYGACEIRTSGGRIDLETYGTEVDAKTSGGAITAVFHEGLTEDSVLKTSGGRIKVELPEDQSFSLEAKTNGGGVNCDFELSETTLKKRSQLSGEINGGGPALELKSSGGSISIEPI